MAIHDLNTCNQSDLRSSILFSFLICKLDNKNNLKIDGGKNV